MDKTEQPEGIQQRMSEYKRTLFIVTTVSNSSEYDYIMDGIRKSYGRLDRKLSDIQQSNPAMNIESVSVSQVQMNLNEGEYIHTTMVVLYSGATVLNAGQGRFIESGATVLV